MSVRGRVMVVDDEKLIRWSLGDRLEREGFEVNAAETGEQAIELLQKQPPQLMLLDVRLPGIDGLETLQRARRLCPDLAVVMMSAHSTVPMAVEAMRQGACDFLIKPFEFKQMDEVIGRALAETRSRADVASCSAHGPDPLEALIGDAPAMKELAAMIRRVAASDGSTAVIEGESGAGKEVVARAIHCCSARAPKPFLQVNCAALPENLLESELFGHERGAFTDAKAQKRGLFEAAEGGTVLLDEISELPASGQAKLLRLLENKTYRRIGGLTEQRADVRVLAASNVSLEDRAAEGRFRTDLYFRLNVVRLFVPPLRERAEDIPGLAAHFVAHFNRQTGRAVRGLSAEALQALCRHSWPGNVRELRNAIERAFVLHPEGSEIRAEHLSPALTSAAAPRPKGLELEAMEKHLIEGAMTKTGGNQKQAARLLGVTRDALRYRLKKHGLL